MVTELGLPTLFITLSMAEEKWDHLRAILSATDNGDTLPTNRPYHVTSHFLLRLRSMKNTIWKNEKLSEWGTIQDYFQRVEFQNRGAAHTHTCLWSTYSIEQMIHNNVIRSDMPDPNYEPELFKHVQAHQIHTCDYRCGGPAPEG